MKARKDYKEPDYKRGTVQGVGLQEGGGTTRCPKSPASLETSGRHMVTPCGLPDGRYKKAGYKRDTLQGVGLQEDGGMG